MNTITCSKCNQTKSIDDYNKTEAARKSGNRCRPCLRAAKNSENKKPRELDTKDTNIKSNTWQGGKPNKAKKLLINQYKILFDTVKNPQFLIIQLSKDYVTLVDFDQLEFIKSHFLCVSRSGCENSQQYCVALVNGKNERLHGYITGFKMVDHINGYPLDNRKCNMKDTNHSENNKNKSLIHKTFCSKSKDDKNKYEAIIIYNDHTRSFQKVNISQLFDTKEEGNKWIEAKCKEIDSHLNNILGRKQLKEEFEQIMEKYSDGYKWRDLIENKVLENDNEVITNAMPSGKKSTIRNDTYNLFKTIDSTWAIPQEFSSSIKLEHIKHQDNEYKFCTKCDKWSLINNFHKSSSKHDGLDTRCKDCVKLRSK
jgi:hypothetical protein